MARYNKKLVEKICSLIKEDRYTIAEICRCVDIAESTFFKWKSEKLEFSEAIKKAEEDFRQKMLVKCEKSLVKLVEGYTVKEKKVITVDSGKKDAKGNPIPKIKEQTIIDKHIQPNLGAIIHFQTNKDPDNWRNRQTNEVTGKDGKDLIPARVLTKEEAAEYLKELEDDC